MAAPTMSCGSEVSTRSAQPLPLRQPQMRAAKPTSSWTNTRRGYNMSRTRPVLTSIFFRYEFGGPWGVTAMMIGFPILMYYLWICLWFYDGKLVTPTSVDDIVPFLHRMWVHVRDVSPFEALDTEGCSLHLLRMPARMPMPGRSIPVSSSINSSSLGSCRVTNRKDCLSLRLVTRH